MADPKVLSWKKQGHVALWREKHRAEWNLAADEAGADSLRDLLLRLDNSRWTKNHTLALDRPKLTANGDSKKNGFRFADLLTIRIVAESETDVWSLEKVGRKITLTIDDGGLQELLSAVDDMKSGRGDYRIGGDESPLWIWWYLDD